jgi:uncharacterized repeat protein (TIGR02543 family)
LRITGSPVWNTLDGELVVTLKLKDGWDSTTNLESNFEFDCTLDDSNFEEDDFLRLTGYLEIVGQGKNYFVYGTEAKTLMVVPKGDLYISKTLLGDDVDVTREFHFTITFSDDGTYDGVVSGSTIALKGGEFKLITGILQGVTYDIVEVEANQDGYASSVEGDSGTISDTTSNALFTNSKYKPSEHVVTVIDSFAAISGAGTYMEDDTVVINAGNRNGYIFSEWTTNATNIIFEDSTSPTTSFIMPNNNVTVTANWVAIEYNINYILNGGVNPVSNPSSYTDPDLPLILRILLGQVMIF